MFIKKFLLLLLITFSLFAKEIITFPSLDGLKITANKYIKYRDKRKPFIILFHQAGWSRGEYLEIAPKLNSLGFNVMAVDLRSGDEINGIENLTATRAVDKNLDIGYISAIPDILASIKYAKKNLAKGKILIWGSSYSASLVLKVASDYPNLIDGVLAFSPGEYFGKYKKPYDWIEKSVNKIEVPVFITSAREESLNWEKIYKRIKSPKEFFIPKTKGHHGSRALWSKFSDSKSYWRAVEKFLKRFE